MSSDEEMIDNERFMSPEKEDEDERECTPPPLLRKERIRRKPVHYQYPDCPANPSRRLIFSSQESQADNQTSRKKKMKKRKMHHRHGGKTKKQKFEGRNLEVLGTWVQCTNNDCMKWRYLANITDPSEIPDVWICEMNEDISYNSCELPEQDYTELEFIHSQFTEGSLVWAKMQGFPWWPAMIEEDPDSELCMYPDPVTGQVTDYHVVFLDKKVSRYWLKASNIQKYEAGSQCPGPVFLKGHNYTAKMKYARENADRALQLSIEDRIKQFGFSASYTGLWADEIAYESEKEEEKSFNKKKHHSPNKPKVAKDESILSQSEMDDILDEAEGLLEEIQDIVMDVEKATNVEGNLLDEAEELLLQSATNSKDGEDGKTEKKHKHKKDMTEEERRARKEEKKELKRLRKLEKSLDKEKKKQEEKENKEKEKLEKKENKEKEKLEEKEKREKEKLEKKENKEKEKLEEKEKKKQEKLKMKEKMKEEKDKEKEKLKEGKEKEKQELKEKERMEKKQKKREEKEKRKQEKKERKAAEKKEKEEKMKEEGKDGEIEEKKELTPEEKAEKEAKKEKKRQEKAEKKRLKKEEKEKRKLEEKKGDEVVPKKKSKTVKPAQEVERVKPSFQKPKKAFSAPVQKSSLAPVQKSTSAPVQKPSFASKAPEAAPTQPKEAEISSVRRDIGALLEEINSDKKENETCTSADAKLAGLSNPAPEESTHVSPAPKSEAAKPEVAKAATKSTSKPFKPKFSVKTKDGQTPVSVPKQTPQIPASSAQETPEDKNAGVTDDADLGGLGDDEVSVDIGKILEVNKEKESAGDDSINKVDESNDLEAFPMSQMTANQLEPLPKENVPEDVSNSVADAAPSTPPPSPTADQSQDLIKDVELSEKIAKKLDSRDIDDFVPVNSDWSEPDGLQCVPGQKTMISATSMGQDSDEDSDPFEMEE